MFTNHVLQQKLACSMVPEQLQNRGSDGMQIFISDMIDMETAYSSREKMNILSSWLEGHS